MVPVKHPLQRNSRPARHRVLGRRPFDCLHHHRRHGAARAKSGCGVDPSRFPPFAGPRGELVAPLALERFEREVLPQAKVVVVRLLGGRNSLPDGLDRLGAACARRGVPFIALPGDQQADPELDAATTVSSEVARRVFGYLLHGGVTNLRNLILYLAGSLLGVPCDSRPPEALPWDGLYHPDLPDRVDLEAHLARLRADRPTIGVLFYRAHWMSGNLTACGRALVRALERESCNVLPVFCYSLKSEAGEGGAAALFRRTSVLRTGPLASVS